MCKGFGLKEDRILALLPLNLQGKALHDYTDLEAEGQLKGKNLDEVCKLLKRKCASQRNYGKGQVMFQTQKMKPGQTVSAYYSHIREEAERTGLFDDENDKQRREDLMWSKFNEGITNISLKRYLVKNQPESLEQAVKLAIDWEAIDHAVTPEVKQETVKTVLSNAELAVKALRNMNHNEIGAAAGNSQNMERGPGRGTCWGCGSPHHLLRECQAQQGQGNRYGQGGWRGRDPGRSNRYTNMACDSESRNG
jgi:hypothetical protein